MRVTFWVLSAIPCKAARRSLHRQRDSEPTGLERGTPTEERAAGMCSPCCQCPARCLSPLFSPIGCDRLVVVHCRLRGSRRICRELRRTFRQITAGVAAFVSGASLDPTLRIRSLEDQVFTWTRMAFSAQHSSRPAELCQGDRRST